MRNSLGSFLPLLFLASACNTVTVGDRGEVTFTPDECGETWCSLDYALAAGTSVDIDLGAVEGADAWSLDLIAVDPAVAVVVPIPLHYGDWRWRVIAIDAGRTRLIAVDGGGIEIDRTDLVVERPSRLGLSLLSGPAAEHAAQPAGLEVWTVTAAHEAAFRVRPLDWAGGTMMGKLDLSADIDAALFVSLGSPERLSQGEIPLLPMAPGNYGASFYGPNGLFLDVVFEVR